MPGSVIPSTNTSYNLGDSSHSWKRLYLSNRIDIGSAYFEVNSGGATLRGAGGYGFGITNSTNTSISCGSSSTLYLNGGSKIQANMSIDVNSDMNIKTIYDVVEADIDDIARIPIFNFAYNDDVNQRLRVGTSAQEIRKIFPNAVTKCENGLLAMDYGATALAAAILTARTVLTHEEEIAELKRRIGELENEIETLKAA
jgi:hypothetical protein